MKRILVVLIAALLFAPAVAAAQSAADSAAVLLGVATRLNTEGRVQLSRSILDLIIERYRDTPAAAEAARLRENLHTTASAQSGRTELIVFGATYGAWLGVAIPAAFGADGPEPYGAGLIAGAPAGFVASRAYARSRSLTVGQARAITFGGTWGTLQGLGWANVYNFGAESYCYEFGCSKSDSPSSRALFTSALIGGALGLAVGTSVSHKNITPGTATTVSFGSMWGSWFGAALATGMNSDADGLKAALIGGDAGVIATALSAPHWQLSRQRARLISISGVVGGLAGAGALLLFQADGDHAILLPAATSAFGLLLGAAGTSSMPRGDSEAIEESRFGVFAPSVTPRVLDRVRKGRLQRVPALNVTLFQARF